MKRVRFLRPEYFVWVIVPLGIIATLNTAGRPHLIWTYQRRPVGSDRYYTRCTYVGTRSTITEYATQGRCGWIRFGQ